MQKFLNLMMVGGVFVVIIAIVSCATELNDLQISKAVQADVMARANAAVPAYQPNSFPAREAINRYLQEIERPGEWYTYALNMLGEPVFYIVSDFKPVNICISLTAPDRWAANSHGAVALSSPALDAVYYGKAGCDAYYAFDATTGGMIEWGGGNLSYNSSRYPMYLDTDLRRLEPNQQE